MICAEALQQYGLRSLGIGERLLPRTDITLCEQIVLIGSGMIWNVYFGVLALAFGFVFAVALAVAKNQPARLIRKPAEWFIFVFRGSPLFIQFFMAYEAFVMLPRVGIEFTFLGVEIAAETRWLARVAGRAVVLFLKPPALRGIFYGALRAVARATRGPRCLGFRAGGSSGDHVPPPCGWWAALHHEADLLFSTRVVVL